MEGAFRTRSPSGESVAGSITCPFSYLIDNDIASEALIMANRWGERARSLLTKIRYSDVSGTSRDVLFYATWRTYFISAQQALFMQLTKILCRISWWSSYLINTLKNDLLSKKIEFFLNHPLLSFVSKKAWWHSNTWVQRFFQVCSWGKGQETGLLSALGLGGKRGQPLPLFWKWPLKSKLQISNTWSICLA